MVPVPVPDSGPDLVHLWSLASALLLVSPLDLPLAVPEPVPWAVPLAVPPGLWGIQEPLLVLQPLSANLLANLSANLLVALWAFPSVPRTPA